MAIDPGMAKCGVAVTDGEARAMLLEVVALDEIGAYIAALTEQYPQAVKVIGNGTHHTQVLKRIKAQAPTLDFIAVDERNTTLQGRKLYWQYNKPCWWQRLIPADWRTTPPLDAYAALAIAKNYLAMAEGPSKS